MTLININEKRLINEFIKLLKISSPSKQERQLSQYLKSELARLQLDVLEDSFHGELEAGSGNLICQLHGDSSITPILFTAHMDTVHVSQPIRPYIKNNYVYTDGTTILGADNKVGIAVLLETIKLLQQYEIKHGNIQFIFTVSEELGMVGAKALDKSLLNAKFGYALDHTGNIGEIVTKGRYNAKLFIKIQSPLNQQNDYSVIQIATKAIKGINLGQVDEETSVHIIEFSGKNEPNLSYECVNITIDIKSMTKKQLDKQIIFIKSVLSKLEQQFQIVSNVHTQLLCHGFSFNKDDDVVQVAENAAKIIGLKPTHLTTDHCSDTNVFTKYGVPTVNLAVGYENIHTHSEQYNLKYLPRLTEYVLAIIKQVSMQ